MSPAESFLRFIRVLFIVGLMASVELLLLVGIACGLGNGDRQGLVRYLGRALLSLAA